MVVDTLSLPAWYRTGDARDDEGSYSGRVDFRTFFVLVGFVDWRGVPRRCWSNALLGFFRPGERVSVYYYECFPEGAGPFLRVHDVADARCPVDVRGHVSVVFPRLLAQWRDSAADGRGDSFLARVLPCAWGVCWHRGVTSVGYSRTCTAPAAYRRGSGVFGLLGLSEARPLDKARSWRIPTDDFAVGGQVLGDYPETVRLRAFDGVALDVAVVPLFNRRFWCGYGYMAKVRVGGRGAHAHGAHSHSTHSADSNAVWAFCDPVRRDSYLGDDERMLRDTPVHAGDSVRLLRRSDGVCIVVPRHEASK